MSVTVPKSIVTVSGGYDSVAALLWSLDHYRTRALFVDYGQPYLYQERDAMFYVTEHPRIQQHPAWRGMDLIRVDLRMSPMPGDSWIPYRNLVIGATAVNWAVGHQAQVIVVGSKSKEYRPEDPVSYKDSTLGFYEQLEELVTDSTEPGRKGLAPRFEMPLVGWDKHKVLSLIHQEGLNLRKLWNCYSITDEPCGHCPHCVETQHLIDAIETGSRP